MSELNGRESVTVHRDSDVTNATLTADDTVDVPFQRGTVLRASRRYPGKYALDGYNTSRLYPNDDHTGAVTSADDGAIFNKLWKTKKISGDGRQHQLKRQARTAFKRQTVSQPFKVLAVV